jgi:uncharacterized protein (TIGR02246 family)
MLSFFLSVFGSISLALGQVGPAQDDEHQVRKVLADYAESWNKHDMEAFARIFAADVDYVNIGGRHRKGVQENVAEHATLFQGRLKNVVQTPTSVQVRFIRPDVALVHTTWDVTGWTRLSGDPVPVLREITTMVMVKNAGTWLITAFQNTYVSPGKFDIK